MARSRRKTPIVPITTCVSEKQEKRKANRALRKAVRHAIATEAEVMPVANDVSNVWSMSKDGKMYVNPKQDPRVMRK